MLLFLGAGASKPFGIPEMKELTEIVIKELKSRHKPTWMIEDIKTRVENFNIKPDIIIECGTASGGSTLFLASLCDLIHNGEIITIDIENKPDRPQHDRITYLSGSSVSDEITKQLNELVRNAEKVIVILDSEHSKEHVLQELKIYSKLVTTGSYIIVEDSNIGGHPVKKSFGPAPLDAIEDFLKDDNNFVIDNNKEKYYMTFNPSGYLKKIT